MRTFALFLFYFLIADSGLVRAEVTLAPLFGDHAVLQRDKPIPIWGRADAGEKITVTFRDQRVHATTGTDGRWLLYLDAIEAQPEGTDLTVAGTNTLVLHDILVGEVWLCSGSAGMEMPATNLQALAPNGGGLRMPLVRQIKIEAGSAFFPTDSARSGGWQPLGVATNGEGASVGFFFARDLFQKLGVPVGLICAAAGSAPVDAWLSPAALALDPIASGAGERRKQRLPSATGEAPSGDTLGMIFPTSFFNGTINPLLPFALRGFLWQEDVRPADTADEYRVLFPAVITAWRAHFGQSNLPFYWVQLPGNRKADATRSGNLADFRQAQTEALTLPNTGQVIAIDLTAETDLPAAVSEVIGRRLALLAKNRTYGIVSDDSGPGFIDATREGAAMRVRLSHATSGLVAHEKPVQSLELAGADKVFRPASARIERETLLVSSPEVRAPMAVRYAWRNGPEANLYSGAGQPAAPFRSDNW